MKPKSIHLPLSQWCHRPHMARSHPGVADHQEQRPTVERPQFCNKMKRERLARAGSHSSNLQCSLLIFSVFNELQRVGEKRATDGSPFETCCLCEVLGWSPEQKSMFMTYYKHTHIQCSVLPFKLQQGLIARHGTQHTRMLKKGFRRCYASAVILKWYTTMLGIVVFCQLCVIFFYKVYCTTLKKKSQEVAQTKQHRNAFCVV